MALHFTKETPKKAPVGEMMAQGMLPLPQPLQRLSRGDLDDRGLAFIRYHRKSGLRYLPVTFKRHDT
jgi:hypothetical protein